MDTAIIDGPAQALSRPQALGAAPFAAHAAQLLELEAGARRRRLSPRRGRDFASNDYLGFAGDAYIRTAVTAALVGGLPIGSGGSRLLRGNHREHEALETEAAAFFGCESSLYLSSGYVANVALLATLPQRGDLVVHDALVHASVHEGMKLSRAGSVSAGHNAPDRVHDLIADWRRRGQTGRPWIVVESLYSMDGDRAPLDDFAEVATRHDAILVVDEAHATGVYGPRGRGLAAHLDGRDDVVILRTCGKALGGEGALVCAPAVVRDFLVNRARGFIFSTAPSPLMAAAVRAALRLLQLEPERRERLLALSNRMGARLTALGLADSGTQIKPVVVGADERAMRLAAALQARGFDVRGIRPPTVPPGTSRLRVSVTLNVTTADVDALADALGEALAP